MTVRTQRPARSNSRQWIAGFPDTRGGEGTADWDNVASNCSTGNCLSNFNKRMSSKSSNLEIWARRGLPTVLCPLPIVGGYDCASWAFPPSSRPGLPSPVSCCLIVVIVIVVLCCLSVCRVCVLFDDWCVSCVLLFVVFYITLRLILYDMIQYHIIWFYRLFTS